MPANVIESREKERRWEGHELAVILACDDEALARFARKANRGLEAVWRKRDELIAAKHAREKSGAFLPDDGVPYRAVMERILEGVRVP